MHRDKQSPGKKWVCPEWRDSAGVPNASDRSRAKIADIFQGEMHLAAQWLCALQPGQAQPLQNLAALEAADASHACPQIQPAALSTGSSCLSPGPGAHIARTGCLWWPLPASLTFSLTAPIQTWALGIEVCHVCVAGQPFMSLQNFANNIMIVQM